MKYTYQSNFASRIENLIAQKNVLGFPYKESSRILRDFDAFCVRDFPEAMELTEELCMAWAVRKPKEGNNAFRNRLMPIRELARHLIRNGEQAFLLPSDLARRLPSHEAYIFSKTEIISIWDYFDHLKPKRNFPVRHLVIPMIFRLLYCCGLRPAEARRLRVCDAILERGRLDIMESKGNRSRIVMMADDVAEMMRSYDPLERSSFLTPMATSTPRSGWRRLSESRESKSVCGLSAVIFRALTIFGTRSPRTDCISG